MLNTLKLWTLEFLELSMLESFEASMLDYLELSVRESLDFLMPEWPVEVEAGREFERLNNCGFLH